jgi:virulence-associated protein VapD
MFAIAFDMTISEMEKLHPRSVRAGYDELDVPSHGTTSLGFKAASITA